MAQITENKMKRFIKKAIFKVLEHNELTICRTTHNQKWEIGIHGDYVRKSFLQLIRNELDNVEGCVAEVGVYQGNFARHINQVFPDRRFFLFDTFKGFDSRDMDVELRNNLIHRDKVGHLGDTSIELVKSKLPYPEKCIFKSGYFPDTAADVEEKFMFVSIDVDLYQPTLEALNFFFHNLTSPGYILVHDYNGLRYKGARSAVKQFREDNQLTFVPIGDSGGSVIFTS
jgi:O-methyltransferase